jgi:hypothetical protein
VPQPPRPHPAKRDPDTPRSSGSSLWGNSEKKPQARSHPVLIRRMVPFVSGGRCWFAIHSACSASLSHSPQGRHSPSQPGLAPNPPRPRASPPRDERATRKRNRSLAWFLRSPRRSRPDRVLHLEPVRRAAGAVGRVLPLRDDAFQPHPAGVVEHGLTVIEFQMLVVPDAHAGLGQDRRERGLAHHKRIAAQIVPIQLDQVEGVILPSLSRVRCAGRFPHAR